MYFFEVPAKQRLIQVGCAIFWCLLGAGPIFGFAALKPILIAQGVYEETCPVDEVLISEGSNFIAKCTTQDLKLNLMFTVAAALTNICALVIGRVLDVAGPRVCGIVASSCIFVSCFVFIFAEQLKHYLDPYMIGYAFLSVGGPFSYISVFQLSNAFPENSGLILAIITGSFDTSSAVFLGYQKLYIANPSFFTLSNFFKGYLFVPIFITVAQLTVMPTESYLTPPADIIPEPTPGQRRLSQAVEAEERLQAANAAQLLESPSPTSSPAANAATESTPLVAEQQGGIESQLLSPVISPSKRRSSLGEAYKSAYSEDELQSAKTPAAGTNSIFGVLHGLPTNYQFKTYWFWLICAYSTIQMLRLNYFVATINSQYTYLFSSYKLADKLNAIFDVALPLGGVVSVPIVGAFLDNFSTAVVLSVLLGMSLIIGVLGTIMHSFLAGLFNVLLFVCFRPFFYTALSDYCAKVFGFETFGTIYGAIMSIAGVFNLLQSPLDRVTHENMHMNPIPVNVMLVGITVVAGGALVAFVMAQTKICNMKRAQAAAIA